MAIKVLLGTIYPHDEMRVRGGVEAVAVNLVHALQEREDIELHVVSFTPWKKQFHKEKRGRTTFYWLPTFRFLYGVRAMTVDGWRFYFLCRRIKPDLIHAQNVSEYATWVPSDIPLVVTIHGVELFEPAMLNTRHFQGIIGMYRRWIGKQIFKHSLQHAEAVISIAGEYISQLIKDFFDGKELYYFIPNPIGDFWFEHSQEVNITSELNVLCVGDIIERKNAFGLVHAFSKVKSRFPQAKLWFAGGIQDLIYYKKVANEIYHLHLQNDVHFLGHLNDLELKQRYIQASIVALPSIQETLPMALLQAMAMGKPIVATRVGGIPLMVQHGITGFLVPSGDMDAFASSMIRLLGDPNLRKRMGEKAYRFACQNFLADQVAEKVVNVYQEILRKNKRDSHQGLTT